MGRLIIVILVGVILFRAEFVQELIHPPKDYSALTANSPVTMYSTAWCGYCAKTRRFFKRNQIAFEEFDIEKSDKAQLEYEQLGGGGVPLVLVNEQLVHGYNTRLIEQYLALPHVQDSN
jgi:glutaredoxin